MADSYELTVQVDLVEAILGAFSITPAKYVGAPSKYSLTRITLANGANTIAIPTGATYCLILFDPNASAVAKTLKGIAGDTGINIGGAVSPVLFPVVSGTTVLVINASALDTTVTQVIFF